MMIGKQYPSKFKDEAISCEGYCEQSMLKDAVFQNVIDNFAHYGHDFLWFHNVLFNRYHLLISVNDSFTQPSFN